MTQVTNIADKIFECIWNYTIQVRGQIRYRDFIKPIIYVLYGIHKGYGFTKTSDDNVIFDCNSDVLLMELFQLAMESTSKAETLKTYALADSLFRIDSNDFNANYIQVLTKVFDSFQTNMGKEGGEFYTPKEVISLLALIVNKNNCETVYDPFCGTASLSMQLKGSCKFYGQDLDGLVSILAKVMLEASSRNGEIRLSDSLMAWSERAYDAVATCPPFNLRFKNEQVTIFDGREERPARDIEEVIFYRSIFTNRAKAIAVLEPMGFCFRQGSNLELRKFLVAHYLLDEVIALPSNILYATSIPSMIVVCRSNRKPNESVKFIDARTYFIEEGRRLSNRRLDINRLKEDLLSKKDGLVAEVSNEKIMEYGYNLAPEIYAELALNPGKGQRVVKLGDLLTFVSGKSVSKNYNGKMVTRALLSNDFIRILLNCDSTTDDNNRSYRKYSQYGENGKSYLLVLDTPYELSKEYAIMTGKKEFVVKSPIRVFEINTSLVLPEYAAWVISQDRNTNLGATPIMESLSLPIIIDEKERQSNIVNQIKNEYAIKEQQEQEADAKRLGVKRNVSDLEHMLGTPRFKVEQILRRLEKVTAGNDKAFKLVTSLKDNIEYMNRLVRFTNSDMSKDDFNLQEGDIWEFIQSYAKGWNNYGGNYFNLSIKNEIDESCSIAFDSAMLTVMLDAILGNAVRHGFHKRKDYTLDNTVEISLSLRGYRGKAFLLMSIVNNGDPIPEGFTIEDYITKGRYDADSGRSGLGGYHVYQVVKGHSGFLYLDSNKVWNMIVDILLPVSSNNVEFDNLTPYEQECI